MSFGFAISDFIAVGELALKLYKDVYKVSRTAGIEIQGLAKELSVLSTSLQILIDEAQNTESVLVRSGENRINMVTEMIHNTKETLAKLEAYVRKYDIIADPPNSRPLLRRTWDKLRFSHDSSTVNGLRARIGYHCAVINMLLTSVGNSSLEKLHNESQNIARTSEEALRLLRALTLESKSANQQMSVQLPTPIISVQEAEAVKDELSFQFLKSVETEDECSWMETSIDVWLARGLHWWAKARFEVARLRVLKSHPKNCSDYRNGYKSALTASLKASWIVMNVIRDHPSRPYVTSGHRQLSITHLAGDVSAVLKALRELECSCTFDTLVAKIDKFEIVASQSRYDKDFVTVMRHMSNEEISERALLPEFQCLADVEIFQHSFPSRNAVLSLVRFECCEENTLHLTILGPANAKAELVLYGPMERICRKAFPSEDPAEGLAEDGNTPAMFMIFDGIDGVPISLKAYPPWNMFDGIIVCITLHKTEGQALPSLQEFLTHSLRDANRKVMSYIFNEPSEWPPAVRDILTPTDNMNVSRSNDVDPLTVLAAKRLILSEIDSRSAEVVRNTDKNNNLGDHESTNTSSTTDAVDDLKEGHVSVKLLIRYVDEIIREYRYWMKFRDDAHEESLVVNDVELDKAVTAFVRALGLGHLNSGRFFSGALSRWSDLDEVFLERGPQI